MADGSSPAGGATPKRIGKATGTPGSSGVRRRAAAAFDALEDKRARPRTPSKAAGDTAELPAEPPREAPTPAELVKTVQAIQDSRSDRGFSITHGPDGATTVHISGRVDPAVYALQKLPVPRQELRAYARSTQQWSLVVTSFEVSVVNFQALVATKLRAGEISRAEAEEALKTQYASVRKDHGSPVLRFLADHPEYRDLFGILAPQ
jgi:hypothetical protein